jgi:hypothetical protein
MLYSVPHFQEISWVINASGEGWGPSKNIPRIPEYGSADCASCSIGKSGARQEHMEMVDIREFEGFHSRMAWATASPQNMFSVHVLRKILEEF